MKIGSLFTGYGGLDMAVETVTGAETVWVSDIDKGACKVLGHRYPDVPNLGDITTVDWSTVEPVDVLTGGFPCQDVSDAGKRAGIRPGTRSGLWNQMGYAINELQPKMVVIENVRGLLSANAHSDMEPCPWCVGDGPTQHALRALGAVLGDLADIGYDAKWCGLRASDVGACHGRFRVFIVAHPRGEYRLEWRQPIAGETSSWGPLSESSGRNLEGAITLLPTPMADDARRDPAGVSAAARQAQGHQPSLGGIINDLVLLPTPAVNDMGAGKTVDAWDAWDAWTDDMQAKHGNGNGHGKSLHIEAARLLPTPTVRDHKDHKVRLEPHRPEATDTLSRALTDFGAYGPAVERWEQVNGRAPEPTSVSKNGNRQLSAKFTEWMMGVPSGWITDVPGLTRNEALKLCGNGVVPQQAVAALRVLLS